VLTVEGNSDSQPSSKSSTDYVNGKSHVTTTGDVKMRLADLASRSMTDHARDTLQRREVDDQFARRRCAPSSVRKVALGAIVASHLYNETRRLSVKDNDLPAGDDHCTEHQTLYAPEAYEMLWQRPFARQSFIVLPFLRATAVPAGTAEARISYGDSVCLSVCLSVRHNPVPNQAQVR